MSGACEYTPPKHESEKSDKTLDIFRLIAMFTVIVFIAWLHELPSALISNLVIIITVVTCGYPIFKESFSALKKGRINMELSMVIAIIASLLLLQFLPAIVITFFALLSEFIEGLIVEKGRKNIELLYKRAPKKAIVKREQNSMANNSENTMTKIIKQEEIPIEKVKINDVIIVREGDIIPIDGQILMGASTIDQSSITGESIPVDKHVGDFVFAGTINLSSYLEVLCKRVSNDTTFAKIIHLVEESEDAKAPIQKMSDKLATRVIQFAIFLSIITFITTQNLVSTLSVIVVAGACGLAVGTPVAILSSNSKLAKNGVIIKGGLQIENIKNAGTIVFDKTGTLTIGRPVVKKIISFDEKISERKILEYAARAEQNVNHPLAKAIVEKAINEKIEFEYSGESKSKNNNNSSINNKFQVKVGKGASLFYDDHKISVGSFSYIKEQCSLDDKTQKLNSQSLTLSNKKLITNKDSIDISNDADTSMDKYYQYLLSDATTVFVSSDKQIIGVILIEDEVRFGTKELISKIKMMGLHPIMLTGDNENVAKKIAEYAGIDEYYSELFPEDKVAKIKEIVRLQKKEKKRSTSVIMVGDGINDAPALAEADVGIAMGKSGTDITIETADVILMADELAKIPYIIKSCRSTIFTIKQNFFGTLFVDGIGFVLAFVGILNPLLAAFIHISSELLFMVNSVRLLKNSRV